MSESYNADSGSGDSPRTADAGSGQGSSATSLPAHSASPESVKQDTDWVVRFNPKIKQVLDVNLVHTLPHDSVTCCVRFSADGKFLATSCNHTAQIYDTKTGQKVCTLEDESTRKSGDVYIRSVCFSPDGKYLVTGSDDNLIRIWDIAKKCIRNVLSGHEQAVYALEISSSGDIIISGSADTTVRIWSMHDGSSTVLTDSLDQVTSVAISPDSRWVVAASLDAVVRIWELGTGELVEQLRGHEKSVYSVVFMPDGKGLVSASLDKTLKYWDVGWLGTDVTRKEDDEATQCTRSFKSHKDFVLAVAVTRDGAWVVSGSKDRTVQFWDARAAVVQCVILGHQNSVISLDLNPAENLLATGSGDWNVKIWSYNPVPT